MTAEELRAWRRRLGLNQPEAAEALGGGAMSVRQYRYYEAGEKPIPRLVELATMALEDLTEESYE